MDICVGNLPREATARDLREVFVPFGRVDTVDIVRRRAGDDRRGLGFVGMPVRSEAVGAVLGVHGRTMNGQALTANEVQPRDPASQACRRRCPCCHSRATAGTRGSSMGIQHWRNDIILVSLPGRLQEHEELQRVVEMVPAGGDRHVVIDFSSVGVVAGVTLTRLLELRQVVQEHGGKLVLCCVGPATRGIFTVARLDEVFDFVPDKSAALAHLRRLG